MPVRHKSLVTERTVALRKGQPVFQEKGTETVNVAYKNLSGRKKLDSLFATHLLTMHESENERQK